MVTLWFAACMAPTCDRHLCLQAAREAYPDGEDWEGGALPLFGSQQMQRTRPDGSLATPLFLR